MSVTLARVLGLLWDLVPKPQFTQCLAGLIFPGWQARTELRYSVCVSVVVFHIDLYTEWQP